MTREVLERKLALLRTYRADLEAYAAAGQLKSDHYAVERLFQLCIEAMADLLGHALMERGVAHPDTYAEIFAEAAQRGILGGELGSRLEEAARMRNLIVHLYDRIDLDRLADAVPFLLEDTKHFIGRLAE